MDQNSPAGTHKLIWIYRSLAVLGLILCWRENLNYMHLGLINGTITFCKDTWVTAGSRSITIDIIVIFFAAMIFMYRECRKLKMPYFWFYIIGALTIALSFTFPLFLAEREKFLSRKIQN